MKVAMGPIPQKMSTQYTFPKVWEREDFHLKTWPLQNYQLVDY